MAITGDDTRSRKARRALDRRSLFRLWSDEHTTPDGPPSGSRWAFLKLKVVFPRRWRFRRSAMRGDLQSYFSLRSRGEKKQTNCPLQTGDVSYFFFPLLFLSLFIFFFFLVGAAWIWESDIFIAKCRLEKMQNKTAKMQGRKTRGKNKRPPSLCLLSSKA